MIRAPRESRLIKLVCCQNPKTKRATAKQQQQQGNLAVNGDERWRWSRTVGAGATAIVDGNGNMTAYVCLQKRQTKKSREKCIKLSGKY